MNFPNSLAANLAVIHAAAASEARAVPHCKIAEHMLASARLSAMSASTGIGSASRDVPGYGTAVVSYSRVSKTYDVGDSARSHAKGKRSAVLPALIAVLARAC